MKKLRSIPKEMLRQCEARVRLMNNMLLFHRVTMLDFKELRKEYPGIAILIVKGLRRVLNRMDANVFLNINPATAKKKVAP